MKSFFVAKTAYEGLAHVTFSGLLNALDGVASSEARLVFMTTNFVDRLDSALIRPGRADVKQYIGHCTDYQIEHMFLRFYPECKTTDARIFREKLRNSFLGTEVTSAQIQGFFLLHKKEPQAALESVGSFLDKIEVGG